MLRPIFFDLYYTLVTSDTNYNWAALSAPVLGIEPEQFWQASSATYADRMSGRLATPEAIVDAILAKLNVQVEPEIYDQLVQHRLAFFGDVTLYPDTIPVLNTLKHNGHRMALVTNCSNETIEVVQRLGLEQYFAVIAYSSVLGSVKPEPAIYQYALDHMNVSPSSVMYVGDGGDTEHAGAAAFGMTTVLLQRPEHKPRDVQADYTINSLYQLLELPMF